MKSILLASALMVLVGCSDQVTSEYATYAEAKSDNLFDRGWLPDILPESTTSIEVTNDLDNNSSNGQFIIESAVIDGFLTMVEPTQSEDQFRYVEGSNEWTFTLTDEGHVTYTLSSQE
ncbi:hypothetical protein L1D37_09820 [Vibrio sp. Isolate33]|uniref:hypothetical protein n=1 Tax=Vibrio sp. Isolate33 TaxID=2908539 RepID=UPI001EFCF025|nr:hypothetical protein [Vibrio sp. Isolate33]MCG9544065.1 hypothetical protein [Vibrio sp. Isolate33]